jgi:hypothetical protein
MIHHHVEAPVGGLALVGRRDRIPSNAAARHVVQRVEDARDVERVVVGRRHRQREPDARGHPRQQRNHRRHVVPRPFGAKADDRAMITAKILGGAAVVAEKQHVHHAALGNAGDVLVEIRGAVVRIADPGARHSPQVVGVDERYIGCKMHGLARGHDLSLGSLRGTRARSWLRREPPECGCKLPIDVPRDAPAVIDERGIQIGTGGAGL